MQVFRVASAALLVAVLTGLGATAQPLTQIDGPRELPPAGFGGNQYVDSAGCVFVRAGLGGQVSWVPRVTRDRKLVCGYEPSVPLAANSPKPAAPPDEPKPATVEAEKAPDKDAASVQPKTAASTGKVAGPRPVRLVRVGPIASSASYCGPRTTQAQRYLLSDGRRVTQCAKSAASDPVTYLNALGATGLRVEPGQASKSEIRRALAADAGAYKIVWSKGKLNTSGITALSMPAQPSAPVVPGARYVQVGAFADPANAERSIARLKALGLPVSTARGRSGKTPMRAVLAGPFDASADIAAALTLVRHNGFPTAFARR
ncbi:MAG: SPOR domain-containing protein [Albidovulum sp.]